MLEFECFGAFFFLEMREIFLGGFVEFDSFWRKDRASSSLVLSDSSF